MYDMAGTKEYLFVEHKNVNKMLSESELLWNISRWIVVLQTESIITNLLESWLAYSWTPPMLDQLSV